LFGAFKCPWFVAFVLKCSWCSLLVLLALNDFEPPVAGDGPALGFPVTAAFVPPRKLPERAPINQYGSAFWWEWDLRWD
jgi:hypothetical protein